MKLWEIGLELDAIGMVISDQGGELTPELEERLDKMEGEFEDKAERIALLIQTKRVEAQAAKSERDRLAKIAKAAENTADSLKDYLRFYMERQEKEKVETARVKLRVRNASQPSITWKGEDGSWPEQFTRIQTSLDKKAVLEAWKSSSESSEDRRVPEGFDIHFTRYLDIR